MITNEKINELQKAFQFKVFPPATKEMLNNAQKSLGSLPADLINFYNITNGLEYESFKIFPIYDPNNQKKTWDNLIRENDIKTTKFSLNEELLRQFLIFAQIGGIDCAFFDKQDEKIWFEDKEGYHRTDLMLEEFINLSLREAQV